jgi:hypothetical protein
MAEATAFANAVSTLASSSSGLDYAPWSQLGSAQMAARREEVVEPLAELARFQRAGDPSNVYSGVNLAASEAAYRAGLSAAGRARSLSEAEAQAARQSIAAAQQLAAAQQALTESWTIDLPGSIGPTAPSLGEVSSVPSLYSVYQPGGVWWASGINGFDSSWGSWGYQWGYYESDWTNNPSGYGGETPTLGGYAGYTGAWGGWGSYYGGWGYSPGGYNYHGWSAGYAGSTPAGVSANHAIDVDGEVSDYRANLTALKNGVIAVANAVMPTEMRTTVTIVAATGKIAVGAITYATAGFLWWDDAPVEQQWTEEGVAKILEAIAPDEHKMFVTNNGRDWIRIKVGEDADIEIDRSMRNRVADMGGDGGVRTQRQIVLTVPAEWNDFEVAEFVVQILHAKADIGWFDDRTALQQIAAGIFEEYVLQPNDYESLQKYLELRGNRVRQGLRDAAEAIETIVTTALSAAPGTTPALIVHDVQEGNNVSAIINALTLGSGLAAAIIARGSKGLVLRFANGVTEQFMPSVLHRLGQLPAAETRALGKSLEGITDAAAQVKILREFLESRGLTKLVTNRAQASSLLATLMKDVPVKFAIPAGEKVRLAAHHIFPVQLFDSPLGRKLHDLDIDLNGIDNGVWLPFDDFTGRTSSWHRGNHTGKLFAADGTLKESYLQTVRNRFRNLDLNSDGARERALELIDEIRQELLTTKGMLFREP